MNVLELFAGIGGIGLGLERAGMTVVGQVEIDPYCQRMLAKHWPEVPRHDDVRTCIDWWRSEPRPAVDLICGGFPCQDISNAGRRAGIVEGTRSSLWAYMAFCVRDLRPRYILVENVSALLVRGLDVVLADLAACGYDAEWDCIPASAVGAPHRRDRIWLVAYPGSVQHEVRSDAEQWQGAAELPSTASDAPPVQRPPLVGDEPDRDHAGTRALADAHAERRNGRSGELGPGWRHESPDGGVALAYPDRGSDLGVVAQPVFRHLPRRHEGPGSQWAAEPDVGRVAYGVPARVDRLRALGNAVVPQVAEHVGRLILTADRGVAA